VCRAFEAAVLLHVVVRERVLVLDLPEHLELARMYNRWRSMLLKRSLGSWGPDVFLAQGRMNLPLTSGLTRS